MRRRLMLRGARWAGLLVRWRVHRILPGVLSAAAVSVALGAIAGHVFGHGLAPWVGLLAAGAFGLLLAAEVNRGPARRHVRPDAE